MKSIPGLLLQVPNRMRIWLGFWGSLVRTEKGKEEKWGRTKLQNVPEIKGSCGELQPGDQNWVRGKMGKSQKDYDVQTDGPLFPLQPPKSTGSLRDLKSYFCQMWILVSPPFCFAHTPIPVMWPFLLIPVSSSEVSSQPCLILNLYVLQAPWPVSPRSLLIPTFNNLQFRLV